MANTPVSQFECVERELCLNILDFTIESSPTQFKASLSASGLEEVQQPILLTVKNLKIPSLNTGNLLSTLKQSKLCPGVVETNVWPKLEDNGSDWQFFGRLLIETVGVEVVYRSRDCEMVCVENEENLCYSCTDLFKSIGLELNVIEMETKHTNETESSKEELTANSDNYVKTEETESLNCLIFSEENDRLDKKGHSLDKSTEKHISTKIPYSNLRHRCNLCTKRFQHETDLANHSMKSHNTGYVKDCPFCEATFDISASIEELYKHLVATHESEIGSVDYSDLMNKFIKGHRLCELCNQIFRSRGNWQYHNELKHLSGIPYSRKREPCDICGKSILLLSLKAHLKNHKPDYQICTECGTTFRNKTYLTVHMNQQHGENRFKFQCETCGKDFQRKEGLQGHIKAVHLKDKSYKCEYCEMGFYRKSKLKSHLLCMHTATEDKPLSCDKCSYKTARNDCLRNHVKNHK